jgi:hypothetical protein
VINTTASSRRCQSSSSSGRPNFAVAAIAAGCAGIPASIVLVVIRYRMQSVTPDAVLGRVSATFAIGDAIGTIGGALLAPLLVRCAGLPVALDILCLAIAATALLCVRIGVPGRHDGIPPIDAHLY